MQLTPAIGGRDVGADARLIPSRCSFREIASAIKKLLDAVNEVTGFIPGSTGKQALDQRKREFVKYSKRFSNTLKEYFKEGQ
jgi:programmed cell death protein 10